MEKTRRQFTPQQKVAILREHLVEHVPVSDLCDKHKLHPTLFYQWQKAFFENGAAAFESRRPRSRSLSEERKLPRWRPSSETRPMCLPKSSRNWCAQKKSLGSAKRTLGSSRHPRPYHRLHQASLYAHRAQPAAPGGLAGTSRSKYQLCKDRYGKANEHNMLVPRDHWLEQWEKDAIIDFHHQSLWRLSPAYLHDARSRHRGCEPIRTYRVLKGAGLLDCSTSKPSFKGTGFMQPLKPHEHWHIDVCYINIYGNFFYLCALLDGCSRAILHWELRESMTEPDVEIILQAPLTNIRTPNLESSPTMARSSSPAISKSSSASPV